MSAQFLTYITGDGDRWDLLAWRYYGDATQFGPIIMANPSYNNRAGAFGGFDRCRSRVAKRERRLKQFAAMETS